MHSILTTMNTSCIPILRVVPLHFHELKPMFQGTFSHLSSFLRCHLMSICNPTNRVYREEHTNYCVGGCHFAYRGDHRWWQGVEEWGDRAQQRTGEYEPALNVGPWSVCNSHQKRGQAIFWCSHWHQLRDDCCCGRSQQFRDSTRIYYTVVTSWTKHVKTCKGLGSQREPGQAISLACIWYLIDMLGELL